MTRRRVVIQKVDLDTALTAFLLGVSEADEIVVVPERAAPPDLASPDVLCIECGGSGQAELGNFDHHDTAELLPAACVQASCFRSGSLAAERLVEYVAALDTDGSQAVRQRSILPPGGRSLSAVFSGMLMTIVEPRCQLLEGLSLLHKVVQAGIDPFGAMPELPEWEAFYAAKRANGSLLREAFQRIIRFTTHSGLQAGYLETAARGALGGLYGCGCRIAVASYPLRVPPQGPLRRKFTIGGKGIRIDAILCALNSQDPGWGGPSHGTIVASPRDGGATLDAQTVIGVVRREL